MQKNNWFVSLKGCNKLRYSLVIVLKLFLDICGSVQLILMLDKNKIHMATNLQAQTDM